MLPLFLALTLVKHDAGLDWSSVCQHSQAWQLSQNTSWGLQICSKIIQFYSGKEQELDVACIFSYNFAAFLVLSLQVDRASYAE